MLKTIPALDMCGAPRTWIPAFAGMTPWVGRGLREGTAQISYPTRRFRPPRDTATDTSSPAPSTINNGQ
jgi:hypothetical protein